ncbi:MAG: hypothetical protein IT432_06160 [Phycisphaerales bacterium]|nr:hypothetical protein [Phycisphaerales bacterium]
MVPSHLLANVGTPLMWLGCGHLVLGNLIIGLCEGALLSWWGGVKYKSAAPKMIAANYVSGLVGMALLPGLVQWVDASFVDPPLYRAGLTLGVLVGVAFVLTVLVECPLVLWSLKGSSRGLSARLAGAVWVQAASYAVLIAMYLWVSPMSLLTDYTVVRDVRGMAGEAHGYVYYVDARDGSVRRVRLDRTGDERVGELPEDRRVGRRLPLWARSEADGRVSIVDTEGRVEIVVATQDSGVVGKLSESVGAEGPSDVWPRDFRAEKDRGVISYSAHTFAEAGLREFDTADAEGWRLKHSLNFANPLWRWRATAPAILPNGSVVFEFGHQIVIMDQQQRIGFLAMGTSPAVVLDAPDMQSK